MRCASNAATSIRRGPTDQCEYFTLIQPNNLYHYHLQKVRRIISVALAYLILKLYEVGLDLQRIIGEYLTQKLMKIPATTRRVTASKRLLKTFQSESFKKSTSCISL